MSISQMIASDSRVQVRADFGDGRLLVKIATGVLSVDTEMLGKIRSKAPKTERLLESIKATGAIFDQILVYATVDSETGEVVYYVADGHQRLKTAKENGDEFVFVQIVTRWNSLEEAYKAAISKQYARFEMTDRDLFGIMKANKITVSELEKITGKSETQLLRMKKICDHDIFVEAVGQGAIAMHVAAKLIDKCKENPQRITALINSFTDDYRKAEETAAHYANRYDVEGKPKKRELRDLAKVSSYFKGFKTDDWESAIEDVDAKGGFDSEKRLEFKQQAAPAKAKIEVSDAQAIWADTIGVFFHGGQKHGEMSLKNLKMFRGSLPMIGDNLDAIIQQRELVEAKQAVPIPPANPVVEVNPPKKPKKQSAKMDVTE